MTRPAESVPQVTVTMLVPLTVNLMGVETWPAPFTISLCSAKTVVVPTVTTTLAVLFGRQPVAITTAVPPTITVVLVIEMVGGFGG